LPAVLIDAFLRSSKGSDEKVTTTAQPRRVYDTLDGLRAAGAQLVLVRHLPELFGGFPVPESFLAVDLFYLVSGVVLANAYGRRLRGEALSLRDFFVTRLIRLYPLYLLGLALGVAAALLNLHEDPDSWWSPLKLIEAVVTGLVLIPMLPGLQASGGSLDGPTWTLLPEIAANLAWARTIRWARGPLVGAAILSCGAGVVLADLHWQDLDVGYGPDQQWGALARAGYSFFAGVAVYRLAGGRRTPSNVIPWVCVGLIALILAARPSEAFAQAFELAAVLVGFPALIAVSTVFEPGPRVARVFALIGRASWGVYILHEPVARLLEATLFQSVHRPPAVPAALVGLGFVALINLMAWALDRWFETPVRKTLQARFLGGPAPSRP
jgi:peptidoglycan/LPS O-acetylase OafA/YrhL